MRAGGIEGWWFRCFVLLMLAFFSSTSFTQVIVERDQKDTSYFGAIGFKVGEQIGISRVRVIYLYLVTILI